MKALDKFLRRWRVKTALKFKPVNAENIFDIGCDDGYLLHKLKHTTIKLDGIDPRLQVKPINSTSNLIKGAFPQAITNQYKQGRYDAIFALAVFEHFSEVEMKKSAEVIAKMLSSNGKLIVTVPHPFVDHILEALSFLRLVDGIALEEHHGFDANNIKNYFEGHLRLVAHKKFQLGLNNVFVFERY